MKLALQLFTLRDYMKTEDQIKDTLRRVKEIGYKAVQVSGIGHVNQHKADIIKNACEEHDLEIVVTHISLEQLINEYDWVVKFHRLWNCRYLGIGMMPGIYLNSIEGYNEFIAILNEYGKKLNKEGIHLVYHNHAFEYKRLNQKIGMDLLFDQFNEFVQFELDTFWIQKGGQNPTKWIYKVKDKMDIIHFKDMGIENTETQIMEEIGSGNLDWDEIIKACLETNVLWACVEQDDTQGRDPFKCIENSLKFLQSKGL